MAPPDELHADDVLAVAAQLASYRPALCCAVAELPRQAMAWDCGYANLSSVCATLASSRHPTRALGHVGGVVDLQRLLEAAWREGFDPDGARHFRGKLAGKNGESAMIGAGEWVALLWHLRVEAFVVEVVDRRGAGTAVYRVASACFAQPAADDEVVEVEEVSRKQRRIERSAAAWCGERPPLMLQHDGHSRTILGVLPAPLKYLIVRDPGDEPGRVRLLTPSELDGKQYQIVVCGRTVARGGSTAGALTLSHEQVARRLGRDPEPAAIWDGGMWMYSPWCQLRWSERA